MSNNIRWRAEIVGLERVETPEVPVEAFREIIVNSFAHMKVSKSSSNEIYLTPSKIHIYNPGPLAGTDPKMFASGEQGSMIRNPLIATVLYYNNLKLIILKNKRLSDSRWIQIAFFFLFIRR